MVDDGRYVVWINLRSDRAVALSYWIKQSHNRIHFKSKYFFNFLSLPQAGGVRVLQK